MRRVLKFESLRGVDVADGDGEGIGRIGRLGDLGEAEEAGNHELDLFFFCEAVPDDTGFNFERSVLGDGKFLAGSSEERDAAHLSQLESRFGVH